MSTKHAEIHAASKQRVEAALTDFETKELVSLCGTPTFQVDRDSLVPALTALKGAGYDTVSFVTAVDRHPRAPRFTLVHQLQSIQEAHVVRLHTALQEDDAVAPTATGLWPGANYMEREVFDMFGIGFAGHPNLERLLMPDGYGHNPLRKDFPHQGIEPDRLYREWDERRRARELVVPPSEQSVRPGLDSKTGPEHTQRS